MKLAIDGGKPAVKHPLRPFSTIGEEEVNAAAAAIRSGPLSGYLGGVDSGGLRCEALEYEFAGIIGAKHAVAVNSATSGLLAACAAAGVTKNSEVITTPFTMSATAAAPAVLGAAVRFGSIEDKTFNLSLIPPPSKRTAAIIITNLFGHPADVAAWKNISKYHKIALIEDNAQAIFAKENGRYAGTIGDIGVFSFNVHKHLQCGEGGICVTDNDTLAANLRRFRNHSELYGRSYSGLNLRMTEVTAAIALAQLHKREQIMSGRIEQAEALTHMAVHIPGVGTPIVREGCTHSYYCWTLVLEHSRDWFVKAMNAEGVPLRAGYAEPLYRLPAFSKFDGRCEISERLHDHSLVLFENCAYNPSKEQLKQTKEAFAKIGEVYARKEAA